MQRIEDRNFARRLAVPLLLAAALVLADCGGSSSEDGPTTAFAVLRLTNAGAADPTFAGGRGIVVTEVDPALFDFALAVAIQPADNKILAGGSNGFSGQGSIALVRYSQDGALDTGFGSGGIVKTTVPSVTSQASAIAVQPDGKILVAALTFNASNANTGIALIRYNADGSLDTAGFNASAGTGAGMVTAAIGPGVATDACALGLQGDGKIVVAGASTNGDIVLYRYDSTGALDPAFGTAGTGGKSVTTLQNTSARPPAIAFQSDGRIILASGTNTDEVLLRYGTDGQRDTGFGGVGAPNGIVTTDISGVNYANAVAVQSNDKVVVAGHANVVENSSSDISLVRYNADGTRDAGFGPNANGIVTRDLNNRFDNALSVALQPQPPAEPLILISGNTAFLGSTSLTFVVRYLPSGAPDTTFAGGAAIVSLAGPSNFASGNAVVLQSVGTGVGIVVAGFD